jgi:N6-adenosine-specific RNA methylase IME4
MVAAKLATLKQGARTDLAPIGAMSQDAAADMLNVGRRSVQRAREVIDQGAPELVRAVETGAVSVSAAADVATLPAAEQSEIVARGEKEILQAAVAIRARKAEASRAERLSRIETIASRSTELPLGRKYPAIYADPPWHYETPPMGDVNRAVDSHYPTMSLEAICALPVAEIAADAAVLFLWATAPLLAEAMSAIEAWGFKYIGNMIWVKDTIGLGHWVRYQHELLLICKRGNIPSPLLGSQPASVIHAPRGEHSVKPKEFAGLIERLFPDVARIELFARGEARPGWSQWGNQVEQAEYDAPIARAYRQQELNP